MHLASYFKRDQIKIIRVCVSVLQGTDFFHGSHIEMNSQVNKVVINKIKRESPLSDPTHTRAAP